MTNLIPSVIDQLTNEKLRLEIAKQQAVDISRQRVGIPIELKEINLETNTDKTYQYKNGKLIGYADNTFANRRIHTAIDLRLIH